MRLLITEEGLQSSWGHFLQYIRDIASGCRARGITLRVLTHRDATDEVSSELPASAVHPVSVWGSDVNRSRNPLIRVAKVISHNLRLKRTLLQHLRKNPDYDCILAPTNLVDHVLGHYLVAKWLKRKGVKTHYVLIFVDAVGNYNEDYTDVHFPRQTLLLRLFLRLFRKLIAQGRVTFCAETEEMAKQYERFCGLPFQVVPHVVTFPTEELERLREDRESDRPITFASFGFTRYDKGTDLFQDGIHRFLLKWPQANVRFIIQWARDFELTAGKWARLDSELQNDPRVTYITERFEQEDYLRYLSGIDAMVLPYRKFFYFERLSRVAIDSAIAGLPFVAPKETWLSRFQNDYGAGSAFTSGDVESLVEAMHLALTQIETFNAKARKRMSAAESAFGPQAFLKRIEAFSGLSRTGEARPDASDKSQPRMSRIYAD